MAISTPTTAGQILTSAYVNNNINSGLVYISTTTLSSSTQINNCFTSDYTNYQVVVNVDTHTGSASNIGAQLSTAGTPYTTAANYYYTGVEQAFSNGTQFTFTNNGSNAYWVVGRLNGNTAGVFTFDIMNPQLSTRVKFYQDKYTDTGTAGQVNGLLNVTNSFDGIKIYHLTGATMAGSVRIYGYRQV